MTAHILDNPVWHSLTTRHEKLAVGTCNVRAFRSDISNLTGLADESAKSFDDFRALAAKGRTHGLLQTNSFDLPDWLEEEPKGVVAQLVNAGDITFVGHEPVWTDLGQDNRFQMLELASLTAPGPFAENSYLFGGFIGVFEGGNLVTMAGERMKLPGFSEVSGVCTHPDHRGKGYAKSLSAAVARRIRARGETAFLHAYETNAAAMRLYQDLGFEIRTRLNYSNVRLKTEHTHNQQV